jgi:arylsulfatase A-like enzyme
MDVFNTLLDVAGVKSPNSYGEDGVSLIPHLTDKRPVIKRDFYWHYPENRPMYAGRSSAAILGKEGFKYIYFYKGDKPELYNITNDKAETKDLYQKNQKKANDLADNLSAFLSECGYDMMKNNLIK